MSNQSVALACKNLSKQFRDGIQTIDVLNKINLSINSGELVAIVGPSGSGKSTLLHLLGGLDKPSSGQVTIAGDDIYQISEKQRCNLRNEKLGFVYQFHHLLPEFTALENVAMPLLIRGIASKTAIEKASQILNEFGLADRVSHKPSQLSGGERQRTAIARALVTEPLCLLADEPTGNLDHHTADAVYDRMLQINQNFNSSILIVTHDLNLAKKMDRILKLEDGVLYEINK